MTDWVSYNLLPPVLFAANLLLIGLLPLFLLSGLDDFFIDLYYILRRGYRRLFVEPKYDPLSEEDLRRPPEEPLAVLVPAWDESGVVGRMLENLLRTVDYSDFHVFVGTYPNDPRTGQEVAEIAGHHERVHVVQLPHDGPTSKPDCLNHLFQAVRTLEAQEDAPRFTGFVIHDAEDVVHPLSFRLYNYLLPRKDMIQLPVFPLEVRLRELTGGHYLDEFAENHLKTLVSREFLSKSIPSAGTGCAFSRRAIVRAAEERESGPFDPGSVTEDYELGIKMRRFGFEAVFVKQRLRRSQDGEQASQERPQYIATREYFPRTWGAAVRQKARWLLGIVFQGWQDIGWGESLAENYMLFRDRKAPATAILNVAAYLVVVAVGGGWLWGLLAGGYQYPTIIQQGGVFWYALIGVTFFLVWRLGVRFYFVRHYYGWAQAALTVPRFVWGNFINFSASLRAIRQWTSHRLRGTAIAWEGTSHEFPDEEELRPFRRRLGDILRERELVDEESLENALAQQRQPGEERRLGQILVEGGNLTEDQLVVALGVQYQVSTESVDPYSVPAELLDQVPRPLAARYGVFPVERTSHGSLVLATNDVLSRDEQRTLEEALGSRVEFRLAPESDIAFAIARGYERRDREAEETERLGQQLLEQGLITENQLAEALRRQRRSYRRLGDVLVDQGALSHSDRNEALQAYFASDTEEQLGEFLVREEWITEEERRRGVHAQAQEVPRLGDVLLSMDGVPEEKLRVLLKYHHPEGNGS